jgi:hypothetical protein
MARVAGAEEAASGAADRAGSAARLRTSASAQSRLLHLFMFLLILRFNGVVNTFFSVTSILHPPSDAGSYTRSKSRSNNPPEKSYRQNHIRSFRSHLHALPVKPHHISVVSRKSDRFSVAFPTIFKILNVII